MKNKYLLINELAKLFDITTHTIRFYEEKGIISPISRTEKGYRLYDYDAISKLEEVLMLRSMNMSLEAISDFLNNKNCINYEQNLYKLESHIDKSIADLLSQKEQIQYSKGLISYYKTYNKQFFIDNMPERYLLFIDVVTDLDSVQVNEKSFFHAVNKATHDKALKASKDLVYFLNESSTKLYLLINPIDLQYFNLDKLLKLPKANYVCAFHECTNEKDYHKMLQKLEKYLEQNNLVAKDYMIDIYSSEYTIFTNTMNLSLIQIPLI